MTQTTQQIRDKNGQRAGWVGIFSNLFLFLIKIMTGLFSGSIAIISDAVNNLSDFATSIITIVAFKLSATPADEEHPYGHERFEYISALLVSCIIFVLGIQFLIDSAKKVFSPEKTVFSWVIVFLLVISVVIKLLQARYYKKVGSQINSGTLEAASKDSRNDVIVTITIIIAVLVEHFTGFMLDGYIGVLVSFFVIFSGIQMLRESLNPLLGAAPDPELVEKIKNKILSYPSVLGYHDLMMHNYGPDNYFASVHLEVPANQNVLLSHDIIDVIERDVLSELSIHLVIHMDPVITDDPKISQMLEIITQLIHAIDSTLSIHDFRMVEGGSHTNLIFDITVPPRYSMNDSELRKLIQEKINEYNSSYYAVITIDRSYTTSLPVSF